MTEEVSASENTDEVTPVDETVSEDVTTATEETDSVEVEKPEDSVMEVKQTTDEVETLRAEIESLKGKLSTVRTTADKNAAFKVENLRLKTAFKAGLSEEDLILVTASKEEDIAKQVELIARKNSQSPQMFQTLQGDRAGTPNAPTKLEQKISDQLSKINLKGF